jgi:hypothetical protein
MTDDRQHIIQKVNIDVDVRGITAARHIHDNIQVLLHTVVFPQLEAMFNKLPVKQQVYRAETLSLECSFNSEEQLNEELAAVLVQQLAEKIKPVSTESKAVKKRKAKAAKGTGLDKEDDELDADLPQQKKKEQSFESKTMPEKRWQVFLHFLQTGMLPWFATSSEQWLKEEELLLLINDDAVEWRTPFFELIRKDAVVVQRLVYQFNTDFITALIKKYSSQEIVTSVKAVLKEIKTVSTAEQKKVEQIFLFNTLQYLSGKPLAFTPEKKQLQEIVDETVIEIKKKKQEQEPIKKSKPFRKPAVEEESIYVVNAGIILLHPFLQYYFKDFDLLEGEQFKDEQAKQTAVHLLYYLATGNEQPMEYELIMEKYLCGADIYEPIERFEELTDNMKEESDNLLNAMIQHWKALKTTSPDGLREAFLQRSGKLIVGERERVIIEHSVIDILLEHLPWNYSIITLPWLEKILYAEWNELK